MSSTRASSKSCGELDASPSRLCDPRLLGLLGRGSKDLRCCLRDLGNLFSVKSFRIIAARWLQVNRNLLKLYSIPWAPHRVTVQCAGRLGRRSLVLICWDLRKGTDTMILPGRSREINVAIDPRISNVSMVLKLCANIIDSPPVPPRSTPCFPSLEESVGCCKAMALQELPETLAIVVFRFRLARANGRRATEDEEGIRKSVKC